MAFWARFRPDDGVGDWLLAWLLYTVVAYLVLRLLRCYPSAALAPLFLAGAVYGWLVEGTLVTTLYLELPFSVVWTGVAWHDLLTVVVGWRWLPSALRHGGRRAWSWCAVVGLAWGVWGACWWGAPPEEPLATTPEPVSYAIFVTLISIIAAVSYGIMNATAPTPRDLSSRWTLWTAIAVLAGWAGLTFLWALPWAPAVLAPLMVLGAVGMRKAWLRAHPPA